MKSLFIPIVLSTMIICLDVSAEDSHAQKFFFSSGGLINDVYIVNGEYLGEAKDGFFAENPGETEWLVPDALAKDSFAVKQGMYLKVFSNSSPVCEGKVAGLYYKLDEANQYYYFKTNCQLLDIFQRFTIVARSKRDLEEIRGSHTLKKIAVGQKMSLYLDNLLLSHYRDNPAELHALMSGYMQDYPKAEDSELLDLLKSSFTIESMEFPGNSKLEEPVFFIQGKERVTRWGAGFLFTYSRKNGLKYVGDGEILQEIKIKGVTHFVIHTGQQGTGAVSISLRRFIDGELVIVFSEGGHST